MNEKQKARRLLQKALDDVILIAHSQCELCGCNDGFSLVAHHYCYDYPLKVFWLCRSCHNLVHTNKLGQWSNLYSIRDKLLKISKIFQKNYKKYYNIRVISNKKFDTNHAKSIKILAN